MNMRIAAGVLEHAGIGRGRARIVREVLVRTELHRVHEDARDELVAVSARGLDEAHVAGVQVAHRGHEHHALPCLVPARDVARTSAIVVAVSIGASFSQGIDLHAWNSCSGAG
jgi:hypothetical protein